MARQLKEYIIIVRSESDIDSLSKELITWGLNIDHIFRHSILGISLKMSGLLVKWYKKDTRILAIEESGFYTVQDIQDDAPYQLDRLDQRDLPLSGTFTYSNDGTGVIAYVLDSGCVYQKNGLGFNHVEFGNRIQPINKLDNLGNTIPNLPFDPFFDRLNPGDPRLQKPRGFDELGHGTHVAGLIGGQTYGVAKNVQLRTAKIFGARNDSVDETLVSAGTIISGIEAILADWNNLGNPPAICNMSFNGPVSPVLENAILSLTTSGITVIVAAGNAGIDAGLTTPARMSQVITVGATGRYDDFAGFTQSGDNESITSPGSIFKTSSVGSNYGSSVNIYSPGISIVSSFNTSSDAIMVMSGTSMSTPLVSGVCCLILQSAPNFTPDQVRTEIESSASPNKITGLPSGSNNRLLYSIFVDHTINWITNASLGSFNEGSTFNLQLETISSNQNNITYSLFGGSLPVGISLNSTGLLSGTTPIVTSDTFYSFTIRAATDTIFTDRTFTMTVQNGIVAPHWVTIQNIGSFEEGETISFTFHAVSQNNISSITYSAVNPLPYGWTLNANGLFNGIAPIVLNQDFVETIVINASDGISSSTQSFNLTITQQDNRIETNPPVWQTKTGIIATITAGQFFSYFLSATDADGGPLPLKYYLETTGQINNSQFGPVGNLPDGITLNENTGELSGIWTGDLANGIITSRTSFDNSGTTFDGGFTTFELTGANFQFAVYANDGANIVGNFFQLNGLIKPTNNPPVWQTPYGNLGTVTCLSHGSFTIRAIDTDGPQPLSYVFVGGQLPPGMVFNSFTGEITGVPDFVLVDTFFIFNIAATDGLTQDIRTFSIQVKTTNVPPKWVTPSGLLLQINEGQNVQIPLLATDDNNDILTYKIISSPNPGTSFDGGLTTFDGNTIEFDSQLDGNLPPGLTLNSSTGIISGLIQNVVATTTFTFTVRVDDSLSNSTADAYFVDREFKITVIDGALNKNQGPMWITPEGSIGTGAPSQHFYYQLQATDPDNGPNTLKYILLAGALPFGLNLNQATGEISGFPQNGSQIIENFNFTVRIFDGIDSSDRSFSIQITSSGQQIDPPEWQTPSGLLGNYNESMPMVYALYALDPQNEQITFSVVSGQLPFGLMMNDNGVISGTPSQVIADTEFDFTVRVQNTSGSFSDRTFSIIIVDVPNIPPQWITPAGALAVVDENTTFNYQLQAVDPDSGPQPLMYSVSAGFLPPGLFLNNSTGVISGMTQSVIANTTYNFDITVSDGIANVPRSFNIVIQNVITYTGPTTDLSVALTGPLRQEWRSWNNSNLIPDGDIYNISDPNFGRVAGSPYLPNSDAIFPKIYIKGNLSTNNPTTVFNAFGVHHDDFEVLVGMPNYAVVRDNVGNITYEVVYYQIIDPQKGSSFDIVGDYANRAPSASNIALPSNTISKNFANLRTELDSIPNNEVLPEWMTSPQIKGNPNSALGYTPALVIAYVKPGLGKKTIDRLNKIVISQITIPPSQTIFDDNTTIFDDNTTVFDNEFTTDFIVTKGSGFQFVGRKLYMDRYLFEDSLANKKWLKWKSDVKAPIWVTAPGTIGAFYLNQPITPLQLVAESPIGAPIIYQIVVGTLPTGLALNSNTGIITGSVTAIPGIYHFVVRAKYSNGMYTDRGFDIVAGVTTFDNNTTTFDNQTMNLY